MIVKDVCANGHGGTDIADADIRNGKSSFFFSDNGATAFFERGNKEFFAKTRALDKEELSFCHLA